MEKDRQDLVNAILKLKESINELRNRLNTQKGIDVNFSEIKNSNHFFKNKEEELKRTIDKYIKEKTELT